ncbi:MAG: flagellar type III secretion system pore protein FliP [Myxococcaceae bacterium]|nr:flagellar type III secretion system pore protein FliP [Myxococcaceae bacterium]
MSGGGSASVKLFLLLTVLSFATALMLSVTSFARIIIVLSFVRQGLGTSQLPPNQVLLGLALALTGFVMAPTASAVWTGALNPYMEDKLTHEQALAAASGPVREFLLRQVRTDDLALFARVSNAAPPEGEADVPLTVVVPAYMVSELTTAFRMGLFVLVPMLLIDLLVASILMSLGMMMVPPTLVSLPLKLAVFLTAGGWHLVVESVLRSFS